VLLRPVGRRVYGTGERFQDIPGVAHVAACHFLDGDQVAPVWWQIEWRGRNTSPSNTTSSVLVVSFVPMQPLYRTKATSLHASGPGTAAGSLVITPRSSAQNTLLRHVQRHDGPFRRLGDDMAVRLPRIHWATEQVDKEHRWLPTLAPLLPPRRLPHPPGAAGPLRRLPPHRQQYHHLPPRLSGRAPRLQPEMPQRYLSDPTYVLPTVFLAEGELLALLLARQYAGTALEPPVQTALRKIGRSLPEAVQVVLQDVADTFTFAGGTGVGVPLSLVLDLVRAARERLVVRILSHTASRDETGEREIEPHFLRDVRSDLHAPELIGGLQVNHGIGSTWAPLAWSRRAALEPGQASVRIPEPLQWHAHLVHQGEIEAAELAVLIALVPVVQHAARRERATQAAQGDHRELGVVGRGAGEHVGEPEQAGVVQHRALAFRHRLIVVESRQR
jgi:hypothetical protein